MKLPNFKRVMRGYEPESVDQAWAEMQQQLADLNAANKELRLQVNSLREQTQEFEHRLKSYVEIDKDLRDALLNAQKIANQVREEAESKAEKLLESARAEAEMTIEEAKSEAERKAAELESLIAGQRAELASLEQEKNALQSAKDSLEQMLEQAVSHLEVAAALLSKEEVILKEDTENQD